MSLVKEIAKFYKGRFKGIFHPGNKQSNGYYATAELKCMYLRIDQYSPVEITDIEAIKTNDYWFQSRVRAKKGLPWHKKTEIFIAVGEDKFYSGDLYNVLIKGLTIKYGGTDNHSSVTVQDWMEVTGDIWFQLEPKKKKTEQPLPTVSRSQASGLNILSGGESSIAEDPSLNANTNGGNGGNVLTEEIVQVTGQAPTILSARPWVSIFGWLLGLIAGLAVAYYLWQFSPLLGGLLLGAMALYGAGKVLWKNNLFRWILSFILFSFLLYFLYSIIYRDGIKGDPVKTRTGSIRMDPPKRDDGDQQLGPDYTISKEIDWYDFINRFYSARYKTSQIAFDRSVSEQTALENSISFNNSAEFFSRFYEGLYRMDREKIQQVASIFRDSAQLKNMNQMEAAEMVVTFIQEIPYYLVHDGTCQMAIANGNDFIRRYHEENKPCLPNIKGGVQSPYEFLHNLKGDCDTRSLLGFAILTELKIPSSVWISEVYGHSILGVGLPVGHGIYKTIDGIKHYGVELTAKGFRLGMVAPDNSRATNWDISIYNNQ